MFHEERGNRKCYPKLMTHVDPDSKEVIVEKGELEAVNSNYTIYGVVFDYLTGNRFEFREV